MTNLREEYLYVQIDIDGDQHVEYAMHVLENRMKMMKLVPKYRKELRQNNSKISSIEIIYLQL